MNDLIERHRGFLEYLIGRHESLEPIRLDGLIESAGGASRIGIASIDLVKGFTTRGVLASPRIAAVVPNVVSLFERAYVAGVRDFVLLQDAHPEDSLEFDSHGRHCVKGSVESETVDELAALPFAAEFEIMPKETVSAAIGTGLDRWIDEHPHMRAVIAVGDCTDICVYHLAMHFRTRSIADKRPLDVIVPVDCVQTYDAPTHDGDLLHLVFLYHMALNGVRVVGSVR